MVDLILNILTFGIKKLHDNHMEFHTIITTFRNKLPRNQMQARQLSKEEKNRNPFIKGTSITHMNVLDTSTHKVSLTEADIDEFYNRLDNFEYSLFKDYYRKYISNLNRFNPSASNSNFDTVMVQIVLKKDKLRPTKPARILIHHLKYRYKLTSSVYGWFRKK